MGYIWFDLRLYVHVIYNATSLLQNNIVNYRMDDPCRVKFIAEELLTSLHIDFLFAFLSPTGGT